MNDINADEEIAKYVLDNVYIGDKTLSQTYPNASKNLD
jgi:hypothetical protein